MSDRELYIGIRPEGFVLSQDGSLVCKLDEVEVMGRDITVVSRHELCENVEIRSIISAEYMSEVNNKEVRFTLKPKKVHIFDKVTEERIYF